MARFILSGRTARQPIRDALAGIDGVELAEADDMAGVIAGLDRTDGLILSDPRGRDGARLAEALHAPTSRVRWIQMVSAGYSGIAAHPLPEGLVLTNQGGAMASTVAEHALALILALNRALPAAVAAQAAARWDVERVRPALRSLEGATVVIVGTGHVGQSLARLLAPFGARVVGVSRDGRETPDIGPTVPIADLDAALGGADVVALCLPGSDETRRLFDASRLAAIRPGGILVNVGRGEVVDTEALAACLAAGHLRGAALDVTDPEPLPDRHPLWATPNLLVTPHIAGGGNPASSRRIVAMVADNVGRFLRGEPLRHRVHLRPSP